MPDLLVKLYDLDDDWSFLRRHGEAGITIRKPLGTEALVLTDWVGEHFSPAWKAEAGKSVYNQPATCFMAVKSGQIIGFGCYDATALGFFGPLGVVGECRGHGTGKALLMACLLDMKLKGYGYAVIGMTSLTEFYHKACGATPIPDSTPGIYATMVRADRQLT